MSEKIYETNTDGIYTLVIEQDNGIVVMEPGQNDLKGEEVIHWIPGHYPDKPISHVVVSHHHNDHTAGIRSYIATGATLAAHETGVDFFKMQISRPISSVLLCFYYYFCYICVFSVCKKLQNSP